MPQLLLDAGHSFLVIVVQVRVHVIDNDHRHDGLAAQMLKEKLPKARAHAKSRCVPPGPLQEGAARGKGIPPCSGSTDTKLSATAAC